MLARAKQCRLSYGEKNKDNDACVRVNKRAVLLAGEKKEATLIIRGIETPREYFLNAWNIVPVAHGDHYFHQGFYSEAVAICAALQNMPVMSGVERMDIVGHSSGGAIGCVCYHLLQQHAPLIVPSVTTFGAPVYTTNTNDAMYDIPLTRVVHCKDPVPDTITWLGLYKHNTMAVVVGDTDHVQKKDLKFHGLASYVAALRKLSRTEAFGRHF